MPERFTYVAAVHLFLVRADGAVLLLRRCNTGYEDGNWSVVAWHLDGGEEVKAAAMRDAREEVGVIIAPANLDIVGVMHRKSTDERVDFFLVAARWEGEARNREPDKCDALQWCAPDHLPTNIVPYVRRALDNYRQGRWFDSYGWE